MTTGDAPKLTERAEADLAARREREATALRANLRRRKEQQRSDQPGKGGALPEELQQKPGTDLPRRGSLR